MAGPGTDSKSLEKRHDIVESKQWVVAAHLSNSDEKSPKSTVMRVHLINPSDTSFGIAVITPRWLYVLAAATPATFGDPVLCDETLRPWDAANLQGGDVVGIGIHTGNALRGYAVGRMARERGAWVIFGGVHSTLYPEEAFEYGGAHTVV